MNEQMFKWNSIESFIFVEKKSSISNEINEKKKLNSKQIQWRKNNTKYLDEKEERAEREREVPDWFMFFFLLPSNSIV